MLRRKTPLRAKKYWNPKRKPLRSASKKRQAVNKQYQEIRNAWWLDNRHCRPCRDVGVVTPMTDVHHKLGRVGALLTDTKHWIPVCRKCHNWIHANPAEARRQGYLK